MSSPCTIGRSPRVILSDDFKGNRRIHAKGGCVYGSRPSSLLRWTASVRRRAPSFMAAGLDPSLAGHKAAISQDLPFGHLQPLAHRLAGSRQMVAPGLQGIDIEPRSAISAGVFPHCTEKARSTFPDMPPHWP